MRANSSSSSSRGSQDCGDPQQGEHQGTGGGCHRSPAQPSAPSRRVPAPAATLPSAFLQFLATREPQKRNLIRINSHSPREAEPDVRSELRPRIARGTAAARSAFRGHHHQSFCIFFFFSPIVSGSFRGLLPAPGSGAVSPAVLPGTEHPADGEHQSPPRSPRTSPLLFPSGSFCRNFGEPRRSRWVAVNSCSTLLLSGTSVRGFNYCE